jgi:hypothetical protein
MAGNFITSKPLIITPVALAVFFAGAFYLKPYRVRYRTAKFNISTMRQGCLEQPSSAFIFSQ